MTASQFICCKAVIFSNEVVLRLLGNQNDYRACPNEVIISDMMHLFCFKSTSACVRECSIHSKMPLQRHRKFGQMNPNGFPVWIDGEVDNIIMVLSCVVSGKHCADYFGVLCEVVIPRHNSMLADWWKTTVTLFQIFPDSRMIMTKMNHIFAKFKHIPM